ncbi:hypothetical protein GWK08_03845 [Leptobacterium flavescens]|uniref:Uncharacterized protein n=1 Tax=Leptobacterium flavescens TaxID=472055 RepID=A0A6P0UGY2_9FLAO|nr:hypothetical protein [Leptobacterium flavescens]NER12561.1 hypothetical protein [Leptobacterium flavescens]
MSLINKTQNKFHHLSQFLAAFSNSYLPKADDDSQSNLGWSVSKSAVISREIEGVHLELSYKDLHLRVIKGEQAEETDILGLGREQLDSWIREKISGFGLDASRFNYELGFTIDTDFDSFISLDNEEEKSIEELSLYRNLSQLALEDTAAKSTAATDIRIWPHHFDTGMLIDLSEERDFGTGLGLGYAIADSVNDTPYYYVYGWGKNSANINYGELPGLSSGTWKNGDWKGALLPASECSNPEKLKDFYGEASAILTNKLK